MFINGYDYTTLVGISDRMFTEIFRFKFTWVFIGVDVTVRLGVFFFPCRVFKNSDSA